MCRKARDRGIRAFDASAKLAESCSKVDLYSCVAVVSSRCSWGLVETNSSGQAIEVSLDVCNAHKAKNTAFKN